MAYQSFESGVSKYITGIAVVETHFPVDHKGNAFINCDQCNFYSRNGKRCNLTGRICEFPERYVSSHCPLQWDDGEEINHIEKEK